MFAKISWLASLGSLAVLVACGGDDPKGGGPDQETMGGDDGVSGKPGASGGSGSGGRAGSSSTGGTPASGGMNDAGSPGAGGEDSDAGGAGGQDTGEGTIDEEGGTVRGGDAEVTIPAGALAGAEIIVVAEVEPPTPIPADYTLRSPVYAFTPHGLSFSTEVSLALGYTGTADSVLRLADEDDTTWELVEAPTFAGGVASVDTASFSYYVVAQAATGAGSVVPLYSSAPDWNDYIRNDGADAFTATGAACDNQYWNTPQLKFGECLHSGEHRSVAVPGYDACDGLTAEDSLGAFDWTCEVLNGAVTFISTGLAPRAGLADLVDFETGAWRPNSVTVSDGGETVLSTPEELWWKNPIEIDNDGLTASVAGTIYLVSEDTAEPYRLDGEGSALVIAPGKKLTAPSVTPLGGRVTLRAYGGWFEGELTGSGPMGIDLGSGQATLRNVRVSGFDLGISSSNRMRLQNIAVSCPGTSGTGITLGSGHMVRNVKVGNCAAGLGITASAKLNTIESVFVSGGMVSVIGSNHVLADITAHHSSGNGVGIGLGDSSLLMHVTTAHNLQHGLSSYNINGAVPRQVIGLLTTENRMAGIALDFDAILRDVGSFANTHWGVRFDDLGSSGNVFTGAFSVGFNGDMTGNYYVEDESGCYNTALSAPGDCGGSRASTTAGSPNGLLSLVNGTCEYDTNSTITSWFNAPVRGTDHPFPVRTKLDDPANSSDSPDGTAAHADVSDWVDFENPYRGWGAEGVASPSCTSQGPCSATSLGTAGCQVYDYRLRYDAAAFIADGVPYPTGDEVVTHVFAADGGSFDGLSEAVCQRFFESAEYDSVTMTCSVTFLARAREVLGDLRGNDNLLCESNETCIFTPNIASYQGEGALVHPKGFSFEDGIISNVTLLEYETNGSTMEHSP